MGLELNAPTNVTAFVRGNDGEWHKLEHISSVQLENDAMYCSTELTINAGWPLYDDAAWEFAPKTKVFGASCDLTCSQLDKLLGRKMLSKHDRYKEHLPKRVIVNGRAVVCYWQDGTKTYSCCHDGDEMDVRTGILLNAIKKWMPGGTYWQDVMDDVTVEYQGKKEKVELNFKCPDGLKVIGHGEIVHDPVNHDKPCRPYMRGGKYGDDEKLRVIEDVEGGMSQADAARKHGISQGTVSKLMSEWRSGNA